MKYNLNKYKNNLKINPKYNKMVFHSTVIFIFLVGNLKGWPLGRPKCKWDDNIKKYLKEERCKDVCRVDSSVKFHKFLSIHSLCSLYHFLWNKCFIWLRKGPSGSLL